jgi:hypothetical protein
MVREGIVLGHKISRKGIEVDKAKNQSDRNITALLEISKILELGTAAWYDGMPSYERSPNALIYWQRNQYD